MPNPKKTIPSVADLAEHRFFVPAYQRGYRWNPKDVEALLSDVAGFNPETVQGSDEKTWYCLQPLVVKHDENEGNYSGLLAADLSASSRLAEHGFSYECLIDGIIN